MKEIHQFREQLFNWISCCKGVLAVLIIILAFSFPSNLSAQTIIYVDQATGSDSNNGLSAGSAVKTIGQGITVLKAQNGDILNVGPGTYYENPSFSNMGSSSSKPIWILANPRGQATISNMWEDAENGDVTWTSMGSNVWRASKSDDAYMGGYEDNFLFHHASLSDLEASTVINSVVKPAYGFAQESGYMYVRLPSGKDPNGETVKLTDSFSQVIATVTNSPYLTIDGFVIEGGGNCGSGAITVDANSEHITFRNMIFRYCRRCVQLPDYGVIEWSEYTYPNFKNYVEDLIDLNGNAYGIFDMVKEYFVSSGNAYYEGALAVSYASTPSEYVECRYNYIHEVFDGEMLGEFNNSSSHHNVYNYNYDNHIEMECWKGSTHQSINLKVHDNMMLNCYAGPMSHQDTGANMLGPHYVYRNVIRITDSDNFHPPFVIKNKNGASGLAVYYYHNILHNIQGSNDGWGTTNWLYWRGQNEDHFTFYNNIFTSDNFTNTTDGSDPTFGDNVLINTSSLSLFTDGNGVYGGSSEDVIDWKDASNLNFGINSSSNCIDVGRNITSTYGWPDSHEDDISGNPDAGPFEYGENPGTDWPREMASGIYDTDPPEGFDDPVSNDDPACSITSPSNGATFASGASVTISASASDTDGSISKVEFYQGSTKLGEDSSSPYSYTWSSPSDGSYSLTAVATDDDAATGMSSAISITVGDVTSTDYDAADASVVSGTIETGNSGYTGSGYANTDNASGNYVEWTNVSATSSGDVTMTVRFANGNTIDRTADVLVNGTTQTTLTCAPTGSWTTWDTEDVTISLNSGTNTIRLTATNSTGLANIDKITIEESGSSGGVITVRAKAINITGCELDLLLDDVVKTTWTLNSTSYQDFTYTASVSSANIKVAFQDAGGSSDAQVDYLETNGTTFQAEDQATNTAVWQDGSCGGSYSELMHCAAGRYIDFGTISIGGGSSNTPPTVSITSPSSGTTFTAPASITIDAAAADTDGSISKVEFYQGSTKLGEDASSPYSYSWSDVASGSYTLTAIAIDDAADSTTSSSVSVTVNAASQILVRAKASGSTGGVISLDLDDVSVATWTLSTTSYQDYTFTTTETSANIKVSFTTSSSNADAQIDYIQTNGATYQAEYQAINTAVWQDGSCGGSYSEMMQCGGDRYIDFGTVTIGPLLKPILDEKEECEECRKSPDNFAVDQNYPNPFNPTTHIRYWIPKTGFVRVRIYNVQGVLVKSIVEKEQSDGYYTVPWNATDSQGAKVSSGIYVYSVDYTCDEHFHETGKMLLIK